MAGMKKILFALLLFGLNGPSWAIDGRALQEWCHEAVEKSPGRDAMTFRDGYCMGMVEGVMALATQRSLNAFCAPEPSGKSMLLRTVIGYLDGHPDKLGGPAEKLILDALGETYPCQPVEQSSGQEN